MLAEGRARLLACFALAALSACSRADGAKPAQAARAAEAPPAMLDALFTSGRITRPLAELLAGVALERGQDFRIVEVGRDGASSHHVVALRDREPIHRHDRHDLLVFVLEGHGRMLIGDEERAIGERSIVYIPRGTTHSMRNGSARPLTGYAVFVPPFDGRDRVLVEPDATSP